MEERVKKGGGDETAGGEREEEEGERERARARTETYSRMVTKARRRNSSEKALLT